jgi:hypothetical protein
VGRGTGEGAGEGEEESGKTQGILGDKRLPVSLRAELARMSVRGAMEFGLEWVEDRVREDMDSVMQQTGTLILGCNRSSPRVAVRGELGWMSVKNSLLKKKMQLFGRAEERVDRKPESLYARIWKAEMENPSGTGLAAQARHWKRLLVGGREREEGEEEESWVEKGIERAEQRDREEWREEGEGKTSLTLYMEAKQAPGMEPYLYYLPAKLASFRFKVKSRTLPVSAFLAKQKRGEEPGCRLCGDEREDLRHFLMECQVLEEERERCMQAAGCSIRQQLMDRLMQGGVKVSCSTPQDEWKLTEAVYKMWKVRLQYRYGSAASGLGPTVDISRGDPPATNHVSGGENPSKTTVQDQLNPIERETPSTLSTPNPLSDTPAQETVPRVNGPNRSEICF